MKSKKKLRDKPTLFLDFDGPVTDVSKRYYLVHREIAFWLGKQYKIKPKLNLESFWDLKRKKETVRGILDKDGYLKISKSDYLKLWLKLIESKEYLKYDRLQANIIKDLGKLKKRFFIVVVSLRRNKIGLKNQIRNLNLRQYFSCILSASPKPSSDKNWLLKQRLIKQSPF
ncbi:MAG: hypothetical protein HYZ79_05725, partial [Candidatus Melainabacteria bacterium]|nr:hypothetical protein [Candidatus Melainabacteria bacterium]